jgi:hypothetical protein
MARMALGSAILRPLFFQAVVCLVGLISSIKVFHSLQPGHLPIHLGLSNPHDLQKKVVLALVMAIESMDLGIYKDAVRG